jgi:hypothetical protein
MLSGSLVNGTSLGRPMKERVLIVTMLGALVAGCGSDVDVRVSSTPTGVMGPNTYRFGATTDGSTWWWEVSFDDVKDSPDWNPGDEPPLPVSKAIQLAEEQVAKYTTIPRAYRLDTVEWLHIGNYMSDARKWIYIVNFERQYKFEGQRFSGRGTLRIPVLLDGRVIEGKRE